MCFLSAKGASPPLAGPPVPPPSAPTPTVNTYAMVEGVLGASVATDLLEAPCTAGEVARWPRVVQSVSKGKGIVPLSQVAIEAGLAEEAISTYLYPSPCSFRLV